MRATGLDRASSWLPEALAADDALRFVADVQLVGGDVRETLLRARRPRDLDELGPGEFTEPEVQPEIVLRVVARSAGHLVQLRAPSSGHLHPGADPGPVRFGPHALDEDRVVPGAPIIPEERRRAVQIVDEHVDIAVVVEVAEGTSPAEILRGNRRTGFRGHIAEPAVSEIAIEQPWLPVREVKLPAGDLRVDVAVGDEDVAPAVVVEVEEADAKADVLPVGAETGLDARVFEGAAVVPVEDGDLLGK